MNDFQGQAPRRQLMDVSNLNLKCAECGTAITELPFMPAMNPDGTPARPVFCREHHRARRAPR